MKPEFVLFFYPRFSSSLGAIKYIIERGGHSACEPKILYLAFNKHNGHFTSIHYSPTIISPRAKMKYCKVATVVDTRQRIDSIISTAHSNSVYIKTFNGIGMQMCCEHTHNVLLGGSLHVDNRTP